MLINSMMCHIQQRITFNLLLLSLSTIQNASSSIYYVTPDDNNSSSYYKGISYFSLHHYLNNTSEYFVSHNQFHFIPGQYYINDNLIFKGINNFSLIGNDQCVITCTSPASVLVINVTSFKLESIKLINCIRSHKQYFNMTYFDLLYTRDTVPFIKVTQYHTSVLLYNSSSVTISDMDVIATVMTSFTAILVVNIQNTSKISNIKVYISSFNCIKYNKPVRISGILVYYSDDIIKESNLTILNFYYNNIYASCSNHIHCVVTLLFLEEDNRFSKKIRIENSVFNNLKTSSILCYYGETYHNTHYDNARYRFTVFKNSTISNNTACNQLSMFYIVLKSLSRLTFFFFKAKSNSKEKRLKHMFIFQNCTFTNNSDMVAAIYVKPPTINSIVGLIIIDDITFHKNKNTHFITVKKEYQSLWYMTTQFRLSHVNISNNEHSDGQSLILVTSGIITLNYVYFNQNRYYRDVISLRSSLLLFQRYTEITRNYARHIVKAQSKSFLYIDVFVTVNISYNVVYKTIKLVGTFEKNAVPICPFQGHQFNLYWNLQLNNISCKLLLLHNTEMISKIFPTEIISYGSKNCTWLKGSAFEKINVNVNTLFNKIIKYSNTFVNKNNIKRGIPLSVCPCLSSTNYNCSVANVYSIFPGQVLCINLIVSPRWSNVHSTTLVAANSIDDDCSIVDGYQLSQTHFNNGCNRYKYTIWPNGKSVSECKLFVGLSEMPEMFYVQIKPCPMGFTLNTNMKACYCDPLLNNDILSITTCNINDATILRPANSWISAETINQSHSYDISSQCPFDYCLQHSSSLNLSDPNSQCQFNRSGVLCGECKQGLSAVFGSSQCKHCSNYYVFIIIPIAIAGIVLVIMLFIFNLTVTNGIINTWIFYVNIISINYSQFCFDNHSPDCVLLSLFNLDLGTETCFYNGMDEYAKMWLQLAFPFYLMIIAFTLIIGSRYSSKLQRLTANRVLKVLATLFLLSYTKVLLTVCQVLFFFSTVTHFPSKRTSSIWSVDTGVAVFGVKFCILYSVCVILFALLLLFNTVLLFPRTVLRFKFINHFKPILDAYFGPYKPQYPFWTGLQLLFRSCFFGLSAISKNIGFYTGTVLVVIMLCTHGILQPFKDRLRNVQESVVFLDLSIVYYVAALHHDSKNFYKLLIIRFFIIALLVYFVLLIFYHCVMSLCGDVIKRRANKIKQVIIKMTSVKQQCLKPLHVKELSSQIPDVSFNYKEFQEPLISLD